MKKFNLLVFILIASCAKQTAPPLNIEDDQKPLSETNNQRATLPEPPEATFASEEVPEEPESEEGLSLIHISEPTRPY